MIGSVSAFLLVFYSGAVAMSAIAWLSVWRGAVRFGTLRELTGIADRAVLARLFGRPDRGGFYKVGAASVLRHRRLAGTILSDLPVQLLFLAAIAWASASGTPAAAAVLAAGLLHLLVTALAALIVLVGNRQVLLD